MQRQHRYPLEECGDQRLRPAEPDTFKKRRKIRLPAYDIFSEGNKASNGEIDLAEKEPLCERGAAERRHVEHGVIYRRTVGKQTQISADDEAAVAHAEDIHPFCARVFEHGVDIVVQLIRYIITAHTEIILERKDIFAAYPLGRRGAEILFPDQIEPAAVGEVFIICERGVVRVMGHVIDRGAVLVAEHFLEYFHTAVGNCITERLRRAAEKFKQRNRKIRQVGDGLLQRRLRVKRPDLLRLVAAVVIEL